MANIYPIGVRVHFMNQTCWDGFCVIHNPSNHHMKEWDINIRLDRLTLAERLCPHGVGHPDPDSVNYITTQLAMAGRNPKQYALTSHGCDGCCVGVKYNA